MNTFVILVNIITILLIVKIESTRLSPSERQDEFESLNIIRKNVIRKYLPNYDQSEAFTFLSQFVLNELEMHRFAKHLSKTGNQPKWSNAKKLLNYESYNFFRFNYHLEPYVLNLEQAEMRVNFLRRRIFKNAPTLNTKKLIQSYYGRKVDDLMLFEDYYAIMILMKNNLLVNKHDLVSWRIKRALYSLAIRDVKLNSSANRVLKTCYFKMLKTSTSIESMKIRDVSQSLNFIICTSKYHELNSNNYESFNINSPLFWLNYKVLIMDSLQMVSLKDIVEFDDEEIYVILPNVILNQTSNVEIIDTNGKPNYHVKLSTFPVSEHFHSITKLANSIEKYKQMENNYFILHPTSDE